MKSLKRIFILSAFATLALSACSGTPTTSGEPAASSNTPTQESSESIPAIESSESIEESSEEESSEAQKRNKIDSDSLYVKKVENLDDDFFLGMDCSSVISLENGGTKFYDFDGNEADLLKVLADAGVNLIRVRIWNDPYDAEGHGYGGGNSDIDKAVEIGRRATQYGMKMLANFHYSDSWADPGRQTAPKAWKNMTLDQKAEALYEYTKTSMEKLLEAEVDVAMVQIGNETNGFSLAGEKGSDKFAKLVNEGYRAVKDVYPDALVAVHFTNPEKGAYLSIAQELQAQEVNYDVFGSSYYPFYHGTLSNLKNQLNKFDEFGKKVMVMETSYAYTDEDTDQCGNSFSSTSSYPQDYPVSIAGQANNFRNVVDTVKNSVKNNIGIGVCYWEGTWITASPQREGESNVDHWTRLEKIWSEHGSGWSSKYATEYDKEAPVGNSAGTVVDNQAFFDKNGHPLESLKVFGMMYDGNDAPEYFDGVEEVNVSLNIASDIVLPETVKGIYNTNERRDVPVVWETFDQDEIKAKGPGAYDFNGIVTDNGKEYPTVCHLTLEIANYAVNPSFEDGKAPWVLTNNINKSYQMIITNQNANNPVSGKWSCHAYSADGDINFECTQSITFNKNVALKLRFFIQGGATANPVPRNALNMYGYVKEEGSDDLIVKVDAYVTQWNDIIQCDSVDTFNVEAGKTYILGFHLEGNTPGLWFDMDDVNLYE